VFLEAGVHFGPERAYEIGVRELGGHYAAREENRLKPSVLHHQPPSSPGSCSTSNWILAISGSLVALLGTVSDE
jgi:hypothetical protein